MVTTIVARGLDFTCLIWYNVVTMYKADVLYINFKKPSHADDSELTDDDVIIRYERGEVIGITILNASRRVRRGHTGRWGAGAGAGALSE